LAEGNDARDKALRCICNEKKKGQEIFKAPCICATRAAPTQHFSW
jgi:hypothetical protein